MPNLVDHSDLLRKVTGGDSGTPEMIWGHKVRVTDSGGLITTAVGKPISFWEIQGSHSQGTYPGSSARQPTNATTGAIPFTSPSGGRSKYLSAAHFSGFAGTSMEVVLADRLADFSGLSGTSTSVQNTTSLSAARYTGTNAVGNQIGLEFAVGIGTTTRTLTVNYTNENGSASTTSVSIGVAASWPRLRYTFVPLQLQASDRGVRSVESIQLSGSTGTTGDIAVVIYRPLLHMCGLISGPGGGAQDLLAGPDAALQVKDDACLFFWGWGSATNSSSFDYGLQFVES